MSTQSNVSDPHVCLAIAHWDEDAPRGVVSALCAEHGTSRKCFYVLRRRTLEEGQAAVLQPRSRRPQTSRTRLKDEVFEQAVLVREALKKSGWDHGPISVRDKMKAMKLETSSIASLARYFRSQGVSQPEPRKRPRSS